MLDSIIDTVIALLLLPLNAVMLPIDLLLSNIPGIDIVATTIRSVIGVIGSIPSTLVNLFGIVPALWNIPILLFVLWMFTAPAINMIKKLWAWVRP